MSYSITGAEALSINLKSLYVEFGSKSISETEFRDHFAIELGFESYSKLCENIDAAFLSNPSHLYADVPLLTKLLVLDKRLGSIQEIIDYNYFLRFLDQNEPQLRIVLAQGAEADSIKHVYSGDEIYDFTGYLSSLIDQGISEIPLKYQAYIFLGATKTSVEELVNIKAHEPASPLGFLALLESGDIPFYQLTQPLTGCFGEVDVKVVRQAMQPGTIIFEYLLQNFTNDDVLYEGIPLLLHFMRCNLNFIYGCFFDKQIKVNQNI